MGYARHGIAGRRRDMTQLRPVAPNSYQRSTPAVTRHKQKDNPAERRQQRRHLTPPESGTRWSATGRWSNVTRWHPRIKSTSDGRWRPQLDPGTGRPFAHVADLAPEVVHEHLKKIRKAYDSATIPSVAERAKLLETLSVKVADAADDLGELDALCTGKLRSDATATALAGARIIEYYAHQLSGDPFSQRPDSLITGVRQVVERVPVGIGACILPWNFPLSQSCARLAMLFAAGNGGVFKGSELAQPPLLALEEIVHEVGLPEWAFSVLTGGPDVGQALVDAPEIDAVCFTGGVATGLNVAGRAMRTLKRVILELGGKTPYAVFADANLDAAIEVGLEAAYKSQGQACHAGSLFVVELSVFEEFITRFAALAADLQMGHQLSPDTTIGPVISEPQRSRIADAVREAIQDGARLHAGGEASLSETGGFYYRPTVLSDVPVTARAAKEELFGPVVVAQPFTEESEVVALVNESSYGLAAALWTSDEARAERLRSSMRTGQVYVNTHGQIGVNVPWGGFRRSGLGRLYGRDGLYAFTEARTSYVATA